MVLSDVLFLMKRSGGGGFRRRICLLADAGQWLCRCQFSLIRIVEAVVIVGYLSIFAPD